MEYYIDKRLNYLKLSISFSYSDKDKNTKDQLFRDSDPIDKLKHSESIAEAMYIPY